MLDTKEHKKLYKSGKGWIAATVTTAVLAAAITTGAVTVNAHADTVSANTAPATTQSQATQVPTRTQLLSEQATTRAAYNQAHSSAEQAQNVANSAQTSYNAASSAVSQNQTQTSAAQSDAVFASNAINSDNALASTADLNVQKAGQLKSQAQAQNPGVDENAINQANSDVNAASTAASNAQLTVNTDTSAASDAQSKANIASTALVNVQNAASQASSNVVTAQNNVNAASTALKNGSNQAAAITAAQNAVNSAQTDVNNTQTDVNAKQNAVNSASAALSAAQAQNNAGNYNPASDYAITGENKIVLNNDLAAALKRWVNGQETAEQLLDDQQFINGCNEFKSQTKNQKLFRFDSYNKNTSYDPNTASGRNALSQEATRYYLALINPIRYQLGLTPLQSGSISMINDAGYYEDKTDDLFGQLPTSIANWLYQNQYQAFGKSTLLHTTCTPGDIMAYKDKNVMPLPFDDAGISSTHDVLMYKANIDWGVWQYVEDLIPYMNFNFYNSMSQNNPLIKTNFINKMNQYKNDISIYGNKSITLAAGISHGDMFTYLYKLNSASAATPHHDTTALQNALTAAQNALTAAQNRLSTAKTNLANAQKALSDAQNGHTDPATLRQNLTNAENALKQAQDAAATANANVTKAQSENAEAQSNLSQAQTKLKTDQNALTQAQSDLSTAQTRLNNLTKGHDTLIKAIQVYNDALANQKKAHDAVATDTKRLQNDQDKIKSLQAALPNLQKTLSQAQTVLNDANAKLATARAAEAKAKAAVITDADIYGSDARLNAVPNFYALEAVPRPTLANLLASDLSDDSLPAGTTAQWTNLSKVAADAQNAGTYTEDVTITFPDKSTTTLQANFTVLPARIQLNNPTWNVVSLPAGARISGDVVLDANGNILSAYRVVNGQIEELSETPVANSGAANGSMNGAGYSALYRSQATVKQAQNVSKSEQNNTHTLPQTGQDNDTAVIALGAISAMLGLGLVAKKHED